MCLCLLILGLQCAFVPPDSGELPIWIIWCACFSAILIYGIVCVFLIKSDVLILITEIFNT